MILDNLDFNTARFGVVLSVLRMQSAYTGPGRLPFLSFALRLLYLLVFVTPALLLTVLPSNIGFETLVSVLVKNDESLLLEIQSDPSDTTCSDSFMSSFITLDERPQNPSVLLALMLFQLPLLIDMANLDFNTDLLGVFLSRLVPYS